MYVVVNEKMWKCATSALKMHPNVSSERAVYRGNRLKIINVRGNFLILNFIKLF